MGNYKFTCCLVLRLLTVFSLANCFGQQLQEDDPSLFHFGSSEQTLHGNFRGHDYVEACNQYSKVVSIKFREYIYIAWIGEIGSLNVACLGSSHQKELIQPGKTADRNVYHGYQDTLSLGGRVFAHYAPTMVVYNDRLYIFYNQQKDNRVRYLAIDQGSTVSIAERGDLPGSPNDLVNIAAYPFPDAEGIIFFGKSAQDNHIQIFVVGTRQNFFPWSHYDTWRVINNQALSDRCQGTVGFCEGSRGKRMIAWTGDDNDHQLNSAFLDADDFNNGFFYLNDKHTYYDHSAGIDGPLLFRKENADDTDVHILWRGKGNDNQIWQGVINPDNKNTFNQFAIPTQVGRTDFTPTLISLNEQVTYMFWPMSGGGDIMIAKARDYPYQEWMGKLIKDEHTLKNLVMPGSNNAGMNDVTQITSFPNIYKALELPDFGQCNSCGYVTQTADVKEQMEMGYRYFGITLTNAQYSVGDIGSSPYFDDKNLLHNAVDPVDHATSTCLGEGFENLLHNARDFLKAHPKEFIIVNIKDAIGSGTSFNSIIDDLNKILPQYEDVIYRKTYEQTFADLINQPIGKFRGKIILTVTDTLTANAVHLIRDVFETSHDNQYRYLNTTNTRTDKLVENQTNFFSNSAYTGSYKRMDWQIGLTWNKVLCDLRPFNECMESPKPGFWHHLMHIANCAGEVVEMGLTVFKAFAEPEDPRSLIKIIGWIASSFGQTSLSSVQETNKFLYPTAYDLVRNKVIRADNMVNIVYTDASDYPYTDLCMQLMSDFNEYDEVNAYNNYIQVTSTHVGVSCAQPNSGIASVSVRGGIAPYTYHWVTTGDTAATATGLSEGYHKVKITDAMGHTVTRKVYVSMRPDAHSSLAQSSMSKTEVQLYGLSNHYEADCDQLIARIESDYMTTAVGGSVTASVWIDERSDSGYVRRHYQLMPTQNAAGATANVTLYFTQQDFDAYNQRATTFKLPASPQDSAGIRNLIIWQTPGPSSDGSGGLLTYSTKKQEIFPKASDVVWSNIAQRWEISFHTEGFGGYFLAAYDSEQRNKWLEAAAYVTDGKPLVQWQVQEKNIHQYFVEYSFDGKNFAFAGNLVSTGFGQHMYQFSHQDFQKPTTSLPQDVVFYRVRQIANDGQYSLSEVLPVNLTEPGHLLIYPNPFSTELLIQSNTETTAIVYDMVGRVIQTLTLQAGKNQVSTAFLPTGFYIIRTASGEAYKLVKTQ